VKEQKYAPKGSVFSENGFTQTAFECTGKAPFHRIHCVFRSASVWLPDEGVVRERLAELREGWEKEPDSEVFKGMSDCKSPEWQAKTRAAFVEARKRAQKTPALLPDIEQGEKQLREMCSCVTSPDSRKSMNARARSTSAATKKISSA
jgi:hypothetical protein